MNVLVDYHHGNLFYSLHLLFEKRLGYKVFRPIGQEWFTQGHWQVALPYGNAQDTIDQYLAINPDKWDSFKNLNGDYKLEEGIYHIYDPENGFHHKAITFEKFKEMKFDLIVASHPLHGNWERLLQYQPKSKFIQQLGNYGQSTDAKNVLSSTTDFMPREDQNVMYYHQEFDLKEYKYNPPRNHTKVSSFVVLFPEREIFHIYKSALPEMDFKAYGPGAIDGTITDGEGIAKEMRNSAFGWHIKPGGDGFGHVLHKWFASGRPVIIRGDFYKGQIGYQLLIDGVTCIDLDKHTFEENVRLIKFWSQPENHKKMCKAAYKQFKKVCNFDKESNEIKEWLQVLQ